MMYDGCNPTALCSQTQIAGALLALLKEKHYSRITVSEVCREAEVSRQTFYSLFSSLENVMLFILHKKACGLPDEPENSSLECLCRCYSRYFSRNREFLKLLAENDMIDLLYHDLYESFTHCQDCFSAEQQHLRSDAGAEQRLHSVTGAERHFRYAAHFFAGGLTGVARRYCTEEPPVSPETLCDILYALFSGMFFT